MSKKKKNEHIDPKVLQSQQKNEFIRKAKQMLTSMAGAEICQLIPAKEWEEMALVRFSTPIFRVINNEKELQKLTDILKDAISVQLNIKRFSIPNCSDKISLNDIHQVLFTMVLQFRKKLDKNIPWVTEIKKKLGDFHQLNELLEVAISETYGTLDFYSALYSNIGTGFSKLVFNNNSDGQHIIRHYIDFYWFSTNRWTIRSKDLSRQAIQLCWPTIEEKTPKLTYCETSTTKLNIAKQHGEKTLKVFILEHALRRIEERLDTINIGHSHHQIFTSTVQCNNAIVNGNSILIPYFILGKKVGYLASIILDDILLIKTFLFITNASTPEGEKLYRNTKLQILDKKFLAIDKLSSFITDDIKTNTTLRDIFVQAGCEHLFDDDFSLISCKNIEGKHSPALVLMRYLDKQKEEALGITEYAHEEA